MNAAATSKPLRIVGAARGEVPGHGHPDWPEDLASFEERAAYQRGISDARAIAAEARAAATYALPPEMRTQFKVRVFINHRCVGFLRSVPRDGGVPECLITPSLARATKFEGGIYGFKDIGMHLAAFPQPERESEKKPLMPVTFQLVRL